MRPNRIRILICFIGLIGLKQAQAQTFNTYIDSFRGDTVVVKDYADLEYTQPNSLVNAIELDLNAPAGRVYELKRGGLYWNSRDLFTPTNRALVITGPRRESFIGDTNAAYPPIITGTADDAGFVNNGQLIQFSNDITMKNLIAIPGAFDGSQGFTFFTASAAGRTITLDNVYMEHTHWVFVESNDVANTSVHIRNSYFVNMSGQPCRRNGGIYDNVNNNTQELIVENSTHIMGQGMSYKFRNYPINRAFFNHNTFVNMGGQLFTSFGYQSNFTVTNNLFINSNIQGYHPGLDRSETDQDNLPHGIINLNHIPETFPWSTYGLTAIPDAQRRVLVDRNGVFWDQRVYGIAPVLNTGRSNLTGPAGPINNRTDWVSQAIRMNTRTQAIFDDNARYPLIQEGNWIMGGNPRFVNPLDLMTTQLDQLIEFSIQAAGGGGGPLAAYQSTYVMPKWRTAANQINNAEGNFVLPDWPIPVNLAYTNEAYLTAGLGGFPLGDLNWFPARKAQWNVVRNQLHAELANALNQGRTPTSIERIGSSIPSGFSLGQNYPNPFNPTTTITFEIQTPSEVTLSVYDITGRLIQTLVDNRLSSGSYNVSFDAQNLASGVYIYRLRAGQHMETKTMTLIK